MTRITDELRDKVEASISAGLTDDGMKRFKSKIDDLLVEIENDITYRLKDDLAPNLSRFVVEMTDRTIEALLNGNEPEMRRYLGCQENGYTGRYDANGYGAHLGIERQHSVINDTLSEHSGLALRHRLVDAHRDLITSQRILDLEDQVASLVAQNNKLSGELEMARERHRYCA